MPQVMVSFWQFSVFFHYNSAFFHSILTISFSVYKIVEFNKEKKRRKMLFLFLSVLNEEEQEKFTALYYKYKNLMYTIAFSQTNDKYSSEDCVQQAFEYIAKNFQRLTMLIQKAREILLPT